GVRPPLTPNAWRVFPIASRPGHRTLDERGLLATSTELHDLKEARFSGQVAHFVNPDPDPVLKVRGHSRAIAPSSAPLPDPLPAPQGEGATFVPRGQRQLVSSLPKGEGAQR